MYDYKAAASVPFGTLISNYGDWRTPPEVDPELEELNAKCREILKARRSIKAAPVLAEIVKGSFVIASKWDGPDSLGIATDRFPPTYFNRQRVVDLVDKYNGHAVLSFQGIAGEVQNTPWMLTEHCLVVVPIPF